MLRASEPEVINGGMILPSPTPPSYLPELLFFQPPLN